MSIKVKWLRSIWKMNKAHHSYPIVETLVLITKFSIKFTMRLRGQGHHTHQASSFFFFSVSGPHQWTFAVCHHMGGHCDFSGLLGHLHIHLLFPPWVANWPQHHPQEPLHQSLHDWAPFSYWNWQDTIWGMWWFSFPIIYHGLFLCIVGSARHIGGMR